MALPAVLSAMREIILDEPKLPADAGERRALYSHIFPNLTSDELEDLSKIAPQGFQVYSNSIYVGEKNLIANNFPISIAVLKNHWSTITSQPFSLLSFMKELHKSKPWRSTTTMALCRNFSDYLHEAYPTLFESAPYLSDLLHLELCTRKIKKLPDDSKPPRASLPAKLLTAVTVGDLMESQFSIPTPNTFCKFAHDVITAREAFINSGGVFPDSVEAVGTTAALSRNERGYARWSRLSDQLYTFFVSQPRLTTLPVESRAEIIVEEKGIGSDSEEALLSLFLISLAVLVENGVILLHR